MSISIEGLVTNVVTTSGSNLTIGNTVFPIQDSSVPGSIAKFGTSPAFEPKSQRQLVESSTATILHGITIVGVNFDGPVVLTFPDSTNVVDIYIVDEGGYSSDINTITCTSSGGTAAGSLIVSKPYSNVRARSNGTDWFSEVSNVTVDPDGTTTIDNEDGSTTVIDPDGTTTTTSDDGFNTVVTYPDGTLIDTTTPTSGSLFDDTTTLTTLPDGTTIAEEKNLFGGGTFTVYPNGDTLEEDELGFTGFSFGSSGTYIAADGTYTSTYSTNFFGVRTETVTYSTGVEEINVYSPNESTFQRTTTPPGTTETLSPNPYE